jgi:hypothetical protein
MLRFWQKLGLDKLSVPAFYPHERLYLYSDAVMQRCTCSVGLYRHQGSKRCGLFLFIPLLIGELPRSTGMDTLVLSTPLLSIFISPDAMG